MGELLTPTHLIVIAIVGIVLFGGKSFPNSAGDSAKDSAGSKME